MKAPLGRQGSDCRMSKEKIKPFGQYINLTLEGYFTDLKGADPMGLHQQMTEELERHLFKFVISHANGNISRTAKILGISRATLRKKINHYGIATD